MKREHIITAVLVAIFAIWYAIHTLSSSESLARANEVFKTCASEQNHAACYEREVPTLLNEIGLQKTFEVIREIRRLDPSYQFCHVLAHKLGEQTVAKDPPHWMEAISLNPPDGLCSNGYIHGVIGGRFRAEVLDEKTLQELIPDFSRACEPRSSWWPSALDQAICYHGMGHLYMFITDAVIPKALSLCEQTTMSGTGDFRRVCREGVFMQIYQPLEPDDFLLIEQMPIKPTKATVRQFCASFERDEYEGACLRESWPYFRQEILAGSGIETFCSGQPNEEEKNSCYESAFSILGRQSLGNPENIITACGKLSDASKGSCYSYGARAILEEYKEAGEDAVELCSAAPEEYRSACLLPLIETAGYNFIPGSREHYAFCLAVPLEMRQACLSRVP